MQRNYNYSDLVTVYTLTYMSDDKKKNIPFLTLKEPEVLKKAMEVIQENTEVSMIHRKAKMTYGEFLKLLQDII